MDSIEIDNLLDNSKLIAEQAGYTGLILTDEQYVTNDEQFYNLFLGQQGVTEAHGLLICCIGFEQKDASALNIEVKYKLSFEFLLPYKLEKNIDGKNSFQIFRKEITGIRREFNKQVNRNLQLDNRVRHSLLQSNVDWVVRPWAKTTATKKTHYAPMELVVTVRDKICN